MVTDIPVDHLGHQHAQRPRKIETSHRRRSRAHQRLGTRFVPVLKERIKSPTHSEESGRRFRVGRSSSLPLPLSLESPPELEPGALRSAGRFVSGLSTLRLLCNAINRTFTSLNSDVVTTYSVRSLRSCWMCFCATAIRSSVGGCDENTLDIVPGFFFSSDWIFSKKSTKATGS